MREEPIRLASTKKNMTDPTLVRASVLINQGLKNKTEYKKAMFRKVAIREKFPLQIPGWKKKLN